MAKSLKYYHKYILLLFTVVVLGNTSCSKQDAILYKKEFTADEKLQLSETILNGAGTDLYYQGSVAERQIIKEAQLMNPDNANVWREYGVPYLKRGMCSKANEFYTQAAEGDPEEWLGYKAYCWLYFYRDYETALKEIDKFDALTPGFVDYPQATSVNYMRGICHLKMGNIDKAIPYFEMHLKKEITEAGAEYVESMPYILLGISYSKNGEFGKANKIFLEGIKHNNNTADIWYYHALNQYNMGDKKGAFQSLLNAEKWVIAGNTNIRSYIEEFYQVYIEDINNTRIKWKY